jgi:hypothetical protein
MLKKVIMLMLCFVIPAAAIAGGKKQVSTYGSSASRYLDAEVDAVRGDVKARAKAQREFERFMGIQTEADSALTEQKAAVASLEAKQRSFESARAELQRSYDTLNNDQPKDAATLARLNTLIGQQQSRLDDLSEDVEKAQKESQKRETELQQATDAATLARTDFEAKNGKLTNEMLAVLSATGGKPSDEQIAAALSAQVRSSAAERAADDLYRGLDDTHYDAELLLTNFDRLKRDLKGDEIKLKALKDKFGTRLDNTLLGQYVNEKIKSEVCGAINKCTVEAVNQGTTALNGSAPAGTAVSGSEGSKAGSSTPVPATTTTGAPVSSDGL